jgi:FAD/FMN-containing dehydrogenase
VTVQTEQVALTNWSKSASSTCFVYKVNDVAGIHAALAAARAQGLSVIPHGAGHSYTDAALNTGGVVMDLTPMHRILSWDAQHGVMCVEPGVTLQKMIQVAAQAGWWPVVSPSTPQVTVGGCVAMNVNGRNAWKCGPFGAAVLSLGVLLPSGELRTLSPAQDSQLFHAFVGSLGLLGITTSITVQLQHMVSGHVSVRKRSAAALDGIFAIFAEEENNSDFMEAWLDGFARGSQLGRGHVTSAALSPSAEPRTSAFSTHNRIERLEGSIVTLLAGLSRPALFPGVHMANRLNYWWGGRPRAQQSHLRGLVPYTFWPSAAFSGYHAMFPQGVETFQAFVPLPAAPFIFKEVLRYSQKHDSIPLWCIIKRHRRDQFLLSYQLDGFSLELNYARTPQTAQHLQQVLQHMIATVIEAGGKFYLAKDHYLTAPQYRQSIGEQSLETFLQLKRQFDPENRLQSDLYRRLFQPALL